MTVHRLILVVVVVSVCTGAQRAMDQEDPAQCLRLAIRTCGLAREVSDERFKRIERYVEASRHLDPSCLSDDQGRTPLHYIALSSIELEACDVERILNEIDKLALDLDAKDNEGNTPIEIMQKRLKEHDQGNRVWLFTEGLHWSDSSTYSEHVEPAEIFDEGKSGWQKFAFYIEIKKRGISWRQSDSSYNEYSEDDFCWDERYPEGDAVLERGSRFSKGGYSYAG